MTATTLTYETADLASANEESFMHLQFLRLPAFEAASDNYSYITFDPKAFHPANLFAT